MTRYTPPEPWANGFQRDFTRYVVLKSNDIMSSLTMKEKADLAEMLDKVAKNRAELGKEPLRCVVVESDWPEYEPTWEAIESRMNPTNP